jgi:hypothetical protein
MSIKLAAAIAVLVAAQGAWAQSPAPVTAPADRPTVTAGDTGSTRTAMTHRFGSRKAGTQAQTPQRERLQEMQATLSSMHKLLKQTQAKAASTHSKDSVAKANLEMWELLLSHLDKELQQLQIATLAREDLEARRAAMYKQADEKAAKEAQAAMDAKTGPTPPAPSSVPPSPKE